jgi:hypothetical protein
VSAADPHLQVEIAERRGGREINVDTGGCGAHREEWRDDRPVQCARWIGELDDVAPRPAGELEWPERGRSGHQAAVAGRAAFRV